MPGSSEVPGSALHSLAASMGRVADAALEAGGEVIGVIPENLMAKEIAHQGLSELRVVGSMHERKAQMAELADAFIALPGGPCGVLNVGGYFERALDATPCRYEPIRERPVAHVSATYSGAYSKTPRAGLSKLQGQLTGRWLPS
jgi:uncharacterized protein (TIGR00730 family)